MTDILAYSLLMLICSLYLCGPIAIFCTYQRAHYSAIIIAICSTYLGIFWYLTIYTHWKYLGIFSACCGIYAAYKATGSILKKD